MTPIFIIIYIVYIACSSITHISIGIHCDGHQANFSKRAVMGTWYVVGLIPKIEVPRYTYMASYKMELSETDAAGVRWLVSREIKHPRNDFIRKLTGRIIRQRFHFKKPIDIWSKGYYTSRGCFRQLMSLVTNNTNVDDGKFYNNDMQLHLVYNQDYHVREGPFLVQILWGKFTLSTPLGGMSAIIYRREPGTSLERLERVHELVSKVRGYQQPAMVCDLPVKVYDPPPNQRP